MRIEKFEKTEYAGTKDIVIFLIEMLIIVGAVGYVFTL